MLRGTRHSLLVLFPLLAALSVVQSFNPVAFRAVSPLLHERQMAQVLAGERAMEAVAKEAYSIRTVDGSEAARRFLENVPKAYLRENELIQHIVSDIQVQQLVIVNSKMDTRAYELNCLADIDVIEVEDKTLLPIKESLIQTRGSHIPLLAKSVRRVTDMDQIDLSRPSLVVAHRIYRNAFSRGSAVVFTCSKKESLDLKAFRKVLVTELPAGYVQVAAWLRL